MYDTRGADDAQVLSGGRVLPALVGPRTGQPWLYVHPHRAEEHARVRVSLERVRSERPASSSDSHESSSTGEPLLRDRPEWLRAGRSRRSLRRTWPRRRGSPPSASPPCREPTRSRRTAGRDSSGRTAPRGRHRPHRGSKFQNAAGLDALPGKRHADPDDGDRLVAGASNRFGQWLRAHCSSPERYWARSDGVGYCQASVGESGRPRCFPSAASIDIAVSESTPRRRNRSDGFTASGETPSLDARCSWINLQTVAASIKKPGASHKGRQPSSRPRAYGRRRKIAPQSVAPAERSSHSAASYQSIGMRRSSGMKR